MSDPTALPPAGARRLPRPSATSLVAGAVVTLGLALTSVSWWFVLLVALGMFGPGALREIGWLADRDEFQRQAGHRAGYHAFLVTGLAGFALVAWVRSGAAAGADVSEAPTLLLAVLWSTWLLSSLVTYWGARVASARILRIYGAVWLAFAVVSNVGGEWTGWTALLLHPLLAAPFFALAWTAGRHPRATAVALLVAAAAAFRFLGFFRTPHMGLLSQGVTCLLFVGPLVAAGVALLAERREPSE